MFGKKKIDVQLAGVGGWLGFLVVRYMMLTPLMLISSTANELRDTEAQSPQLLEMANWLKYKSILWPAVWIFIAIAIYAGYCLWKVHVRQSVITAIISEWFLSVGSFVVIYVIMQMSFGEAPPIEPELVGSLFGSAAMSTIWTAYLLRSSRVKNTYL